jgi:hypothetical protein
MAQGVSVFQMFSVFAEFERDHEGAEPYLIAISGGMLVSRRRTLATLDEMARSGP